MIHGGGIDREYRIASHEQEREQQCRTIVHSRESHKHETSSLIRREQSGGGGELNIYRA